MKRYSTDLKIVLCAMAALFFLTACNGSGMDKEAGTMGETKGQGTQESSGDESDAEKAIFQAFVLEVGKGNYLVEPAEGSSELRSANRIFVSATGVDPASEPEVGDIIEIVYDGLIAESNPAQILNVYGIRVVEKKGEWDHIPMIMVDGILYYSTGEESSVTGRCGVMDGEITSAVDGTETPAEDNQSNFGAGFGYQYGSDGSIEVSMDGKWIVFRRREGEDGESGVLQEKLTELAGQYHVFTAEQTGIMHTGTDQWFDPDGLLDAAILDFDGDGTKEMLVFVPEECSHTYENSRHIQMDMWKVEDGQAILSDSMVYSAYVESAIYPGNRIEVPFPAPFGSEEMLLVYAVPDDEAYRLICGARYGTSFFADGSWRGYWVLEYRNGKFQYDSSFTCPGPGSAGFEFTGYEFSDGICTGSELYYSEQDDNRDAALFESYEDAFGGFFQKQGLKLAGISGEYGTGWNACDSILRAALDEQPDCIKMLSFENLMTYSEFDKETYEQTAKFEALLSRGNELLNTWEVGNR